MVSTASYEARAFGVGSGMPLRIAARKVPDAVILPVDAEAYLAASETVMATLRAQPGVTVQVLGWDEAFLGTETEDPEAYARQVQAAVLERTRLHCSVGIGDTLVRAKVATGFGKPAGVFRLTAENWLDTDPTKRARRIGENRTDSRRFEECRYSVPRVRSHERSHFRQVQIRDTSPTARRVTGRLHAPAGAGEPSGISISVRPNNSASVSQKLQLFAS